MKKKTLFRIACLCFAIVFVFLSLPLSTSAISNVASTDVYSDLKTMGVDLSLYKPSTELKSAKIMTFLEYGYDEGNNFSDYGIYIYVYNPTREEISLSSHANSIQIVTKSLAGKVTSNKKYSLLFVSKSTEKDGSGLGNLYYKFKVRLDASFLGQLSKDKRIYNVVDLELQYGKEVNPRSANISNTYICTGYQAYHHTDSRTGKLSDKSTHYCVTENLETIDVELHPATWKSTSSDKGDHYQYEVSSVYFSIPDYYLEKYGDISDENYKGFYAVDGEWYEYKINGIVSNNRSFINTAKNYIGVQAYPEKGDNWKLFTMEDIRDIKSSGDVSLTYTYDDRVPFGFISVYHDPLGRLKSFNRAPSDTIYNTISSYQKIKGFCNAMYGSSDGKLLVSTENLMSEIFDSDNPIALDHVDEGRTLGYNPYHITVDDPSLNSQIAAYSTEKSLLRRLFTGQLHLSADATGYDDIRPIVMVEPDDLAGLSTDAAVSKEFFVCEQDVDSFENFVLDQKDRTSYLLRFAVTDYYVDEINVTSNDREAYAGEHYYFEKKIFHNFDVLSFTFKNQEGKYTIVPVSSKPITIVGNVTEDPDDEFKEQIKDIFKDKDDETGMPNWLRFVIFLAGSFIILFVITKLYGFLNKQRNLRLDTKLKRTELKHANDNLGYARDENERKWNSDRRDEDKNARDYDKHTKYDADRNRREWNEDRRREERHRKLFGFSPKKGGEDKE